MKRALLLVFITIGTTNLYAQENTMNALNIKMNTLNWVAKYPSLAAEFQIGQKSSIQFRAYAADIVFISRNRTSAASLSYKQYFGNKNGINGFYAGIGIDNHFDLDNHLNHQGFNWGNDFGIGPQFTAGYQITKPSRIVLDFGLSYSVYLNSSKTGAGVIVGLGYRISK